MLVKFQKMLAVSVLDLGATSELSQNWRGNAATSSRKLIIRQNIDPLHGRGVQHQDARQTSDA